MRTMGTLLTVIVIGALCYLGWDQWSKRTAAEARAEAAESRLGLAGTRLLKEVFATRGDLRVGRLTGKVSTPSRVPGILFDKTQITVVPFTVDYFLDLSKVRADSIRFDDRSDKVFIDIPDVSRDKPAVNMEDAEIKQSGVIIFRGESIRLSKQASAQARLYATERAQTDKMIEKARRSARLQIDQLASRLYRAAGRDLRIVVRFPWEQGASGQDWDQSASIKEVINQ